MTDFDEIIDRRNTCSIKYDFTVKRGKPEGVMPLWVADMDFRTPDCVIHALEEKARHGIFGYSESMDDYFDVLKEWFISQYSWDIKPEWLIKTPGVVSAINTAVHSLTEPGDPVLIQQPVYYPFTEAVVSNKRRLIVNELVYSGGRYSIDFEDFEKKITENGVKLFILCNPHNPVGRVWTRDELIRVGDICLKHGVIVISDEIHADFIYPGRKHTVFADLKPEYRDMTITCTAPSKTFNLAGLQVSNIFIPDETMNLKFKQQMRRNGYSHVNIMGIVACKAAYAGGLEWLGDLRTYIKGNLDYLRGFLESSLPEVKLIEPEGTYLIWLDCRELGLSGTELDDFIIKKAGLWLDGGAMFGAGGESFQRINIACPRAILIKALSQLEKAVRGIKKDI